MLNLPRLGQPPRVRHPAPPEDGAISDVRGQAPRPGVPGERIRFNTSVGGILTGVAKPRRWRFLLLGSVLAKGNRPLKPHADLLSSSELEWGGS